MGLGFSGHVTLKLSNESGQPAVKRRAGIEIGQLCVFRLSSPRRAPLRLGHLRLPLPGPTRARPEPVGPELPHLADLLKIKSLLS